MAETRELAPPKLTLPAAEADLLIGEYARAGVILEYGTGGSTVLAGDAEGRTVFSVESDRDWLDDLAAWFAAHPPRAAVHLHHADVGPTGKWGAPTNNRAWARFHRYPLGVWEREDFVHPDLVLIDGRFRAGCLLATLFRIDRPVTVLFDDYTGRPGYHAVERYVQPSELVGRMARFELTPMDMPRTDLAWVMDQFTKRQ